MSRNLMGKEGWHTEEEDRGCDGYRGDQSSLCSEPNRRGQFHGRKSNEGHEDDEVESNRVQSYGQDHVDLKQYVHRKRDNSP